MLKRTIKLIMALVISFFVIASAGTRTCLAASALIDITADSNDIRVGNIFHVFISIESDVAIGNFEANLIYDDSLMQYNGGASVISGDGGFLKISDMYVTEGDTSRKYSLEFEALKAGKAKVEFYGRIMVYDFENDMEMPVSSNVLEIEIKPEESASSDARLKSLQVYPAGLNPEFAPDIYEYYINVGHETERLVISATPFDVNATVSVSGNENLNEGDNNVVISVLSEAGDIIEYKIKAYREPAADDPVPDTGENEERPDDYFELREEDGRIFAIFGGRYEIIRPGDDIAIPEGYKSGTITISGVTIPAYIPENNNQSEYVLVYAINEFGNRGFYKYDRIEKTLQRFSDSSWTIESGDKAISGKAEDNSSLTKAVFVIILLCGLCILMTFITVRMYIKLKGYKDDDLD